MTKEELKAIIEAHAKWARGEAEGKRVDLRGADLEGADLRGAYLEGAYLGGVDLRGADLEGADLRGAYLGGAYLGGAYLRGAYLGGADLGGERKITALITRITRIEDEYEFFAWRTDKGDFIKAGCRFMSVDEYRTHVASTYPNTTKAAETLAILDFIEARFKAVGGKP